MFQIWVSSMKFHEKRFEYLWLFFEVFFAHFFYYFNTIMPLILEMLAFTMICFILLFCSSLVVIQYFYSWIAVGSFRNVLRIIFKNWNIFQILNGYTKERYYVAELKRFQYMGEYIIFNAERIAMERKPHRKNHQALPNLLRN